MIYDPKDDPSDDLEFLEFVTFTLLPLCGCGMPDEVVELFRDVLREHAARKAAATLDEAIAVGKALQDSFKDERLYWLALYALEHADLTEHGCSARVGWLLPRGERYLALLEKHGCETQWQMRAAEAAANAEKN